jgi:hypothetical protein
MGACSSSDCTETLTCDTGGNDATGDGASLADGLDVSATDQAVDSGPGDSGRIDVRSDSTSDSPPDGVTDVANTDGSADVTPDHAAEGSVSDAASEETGPPTCQGTCTAAVPAGFQGPVAYVQETGSPASSPPSCAGAYTIDVLDAFATPLFSPATCQCACGSVSGGCSSPAVETYTDNACINECFQVVAGACTADSCGSSSQSAKITMPSQPQGGSCSANVQKTVPTWSSTQDWSVAGRACATSSVFSGTGCPATEICASVPSAPYGPALCVWEAGNVACPSAYPVKYLLYTSGTDGRDCSNGCSCGSPSGVSCSATVTLSSSSSTCGAGTLLNGGGACNMYGSMATPYVSATVTPSGGSCTPGGTASPTGTITPTGATTVCCGS